MGRTGLESADYPAGIFASDIEANEDNMAAGQTQLNSQPQLTSFEPDIRQYVHKIVQAASAAVPTRQIHYLTRLLASYGSESFSSLEESRGPRPHAGRRRDSVPDSNGASRTTNTFSGSALNGLRQTTESAGFSLLSERNSICITQPGNLCV